MSTHRNIALWLASFVLAVLSFVVLAWVMTSGFDMLVRATMPDVFAAQAEHYTNALEGDNEALLAYCNSPQRPDRYFGDCVARVQLEATIIAEREGGE